MDSFKGPSSTISASMAIINLPSEVPPPLLMTGSLPVVSLIAAITLFIKKSLVVKNGFPLNDQFNSYFKFKEFSISSKPAIRSSLVDSEQNLKLKSIFSSPGTIFPAPVPELIFDI